MSNRFWFYSSELAPNSVLINMRRLGNLHQVNVFRDNEKERLGELEEVAFERAKTRPTLCRQLASRACHAPSISTLCRNLRYFIINLFHGESNSGVSSSI
jgi:hypothetical protein